ncbi:Rrf2 family transcriptional regulator [Thioclava sp. BHET1]|nr:Rrf2 family transcriptional regulator [Thioclava sp. BHET1]
MRLTTRSSLALRTLMACAVNEGQTLRKSDIATSCNASENHLGQVVCQLAQMGYIETLRGRCGGLRLARPMDEIRIGEVVRAFENCIGFADCFEKEENLCPLSGPCRLSSALVEALEAFYASLDKRTLADLVVGNDGLKFLLSRPAEAAVTTAACD